ncbi:MAG: 30S ribosomal protein S3 [Rickettsiella sp.]|nr:30S ribosomal protein S3 [Rickettsiella sp.]
MGHKVNPVGIRLNITRTSTAKWYAKPQEYAELLIADLKARALIEKVLVQAGVSSIQIERTARNAKITIYVARPGVVIGKKGEYIEGLRKKVEKCMLTSVSLSVVEVKKPELDAKLVAESIAQQLERRVMFRRAMKRPVQTALRLGAKGIKIEVSGRLGGAEIARSERYHEGSVPLHTFRANIDYALAEAQTTYGKLGVKVWINKGEIFDRSQISFPESTEAKSHYSNEKDQRHYNRRRLPKTKPASKQTAESTH